MKLWRERLQAVRVELALFGGVALVLAMFSGPRFLRQSEAPHFVYQAKSWLEGRLDVAPEVLPNVEDWACVREVAGKKQRCARPLQPGDRWYSSFPWFPAVVMLPFVALHGYQFNDTSFGVLVGALAVVLLYRLLRTLGRHEGSEQTTTQSAAWALWFAFGTVFFYCAIRGEVWFLAEVMGVCFTCAYALCAYKARRPLAAGVFFSMAVLTRTPLLFSAVFFVMELGMPGGWQGLRALLRKLTERKGQLARCVAGAAPLALVAVAYNLYRFGNPLEFGHRYFFENRVNTDIDTWGLFHPHYLSRNLEAAFFKLPVWQGQPPALGYDPHGLSLFLTLPVLFLVLWPRQRARLLPALWATVGACALPGLFYQNTGYAQFGFRFSLDYTPWIFALLAMSGWTLRSLWVKAVLALSLLVNVWGAVVFRGYTEYVRRLP